MVASNGSLEALGAALDDADGCDALGDAALGEGLAAAPQPAMTSAMTEVTTASLRNLLNAT